MDKNLTQREQLSALADGQLEGDAWEQALQCAHDEEGRSTWNLYHLVGDVLRSPELAQHADNGAFVQRLQLRLADEPVPGRPAQDSLQTAVPVQLAATPIPVAANASIFQWKMVAGLASVAAVAVVGWVSWSSLQTSPAGASMAALSSAPAASAPVAAPPAAASVLAQAGASPSAEPIMLRDPRLDELLAAHQQFGATSALQMPARFLRNATFEAPKR